MKKLIRSFRVLFGYHLIVYTSEKNITQEDLQKLFPSWPVTLIYNQSFDNIEIQYP